VGQDLIGRAESHTENPVQKLAKESPHTRRYRPKSIGHSIGPSGEHFSKLIVVRLGIADQVKPKITVVRGMLVASAVAKGDVEIGINQIGELMPNPGIDIVETLPADLNRTVVYATALTTMAKQPEAARELVKCLVLPSSVPVIKNNGMDPA
jgi:molybdate transport system substrate-binding protein